MAESIKSQEFWLPGSQTFTDDNKGGTLFIRDRDGAEVNFSFIFDESVTGFQFKSMQVYLSRGITIADVKNESWEIQSEDGLLKLTLLSQ